MRAAVRSWTSSAPRPRGTLGPASPGLHWRPGSPMRGATAWRARAATTLPNQGEDHDWNAEDDVKGGILDAGAVRAARAREIAFLVDREVFEVVPASLARKEGARVVGLKWIDTNKGSAQEPVVRSRLVATEVRPKYAEPVHAITPPLDAVRAVLAIAAAGQDSDPRNRFRGGGFQLACCDVARAHLYAPARRRVFVRLPPEAFGDGGGPGEARVGLLRRTMYGTLDAAAERHRHYASVLERAGFAKGRSNGCVFHLPGRSTVVVVHGDDFLATGKLADLRALESVLRAAYELPSAHYAGYGPNVKRELVVLGRRAVLEDSGLKSYADARLIDGVIRDLQLENSRPSSSPHLAEKHGHAGKPLLARRAGLIMAAERVADCLSMELPLSSESLASDEQEGLPPDLARRYAGRIGSLAAKLMYLAHDRPDFAYTAKELMRKLASPRQCDRARLLTLGRYLLRQPTVALVFPYTPLENVVVALADSDHAGCPWSRRSTAGAVLLWGSAPLKFISRTISTICLRPPSRISRRSRCALPRR